MVSWLQGRNGTTEGHDKTQWLTLWHLGSTQRERRRQAQEYTLPCQAPSEHLTKPGAAS